ncbi:MAG: hypothetical protein AAFR12_03770 [Cyanobacteria bacterium J06626_6]
MLSVFLSFSALAAPALTGSLQGFLPDGLSAGLLAQAAIPVIPVEEALPPPESLLAPGSEAVEMANYSDGTMSIDYPATWQVEVDDSGIVAIKAESVASARQVVTQIFRVDSPPGPLVDANINSFIDEGSAVSRYRSVVIDDQTALVMWLADRPDELSSAIATFIGYGDETIFLFSRYSPEGADTEAVDTEDNILRLHSSFSNLAAELPASPGLDDLLLQ